MLTHDRKEMILQYIEDKMNHRQVYAAMGYLLKEYWSVITRENISDENLIKFLDGVIYPF